MICEGAHEHWWVLSPRYPHGQGFCAATSMHLAGKVVLPFAREMETTLSSIGCLRLSNTERGNSGNSSKKRTPRWASVISPGLGLEPPPISPTSEVVWCGERNGRLCITPSLPRFPAMEYILVTSSISSNVSRGSIEASVRAIMVFPAPGGPFKRILCPPAAAISIARFV